MKWYRKLYVSESIGDKVGRIKWKINHNAGTVSVYVIAFASNPDNLLDSVAAYAEKLSEEESEDHRSGEGIRCCDRTYAADY